MCHVALSVAVTGLRCWLKAKPAFEQVQAISWTVLLMAVLEGSYYFLSGADRDLFM